jgi:radical SAM-linked protein
MAFPSAGSDLSGAPNETEQEVSQSIGTGETEPSMIRQRVRIRFQKNGDLRLIGHRDLLRTFERLLRRCGVALSMSEGFHPKPRMSFPLALALGVEGVNEVMEAELAEPLLAEELARRLADHAPDGLTIKDVTLVPPGTRKARARMVSYEVPVAGERQPAVQASVAELLSRDSCVVEREGAGRPIDVLGGIDHLHLEEGVLSMRLKVTDQADVRPTEVLQALGAADLVENRFCLRRTDVEVTT